MTSRKIGGNTASKFKPRIGYKTVAKQGYSGILASNAVPVDARFPALYATVDMRPSTVRSVATDKYYGGPQSEGNIFSNGQGNLLRSYITNTSPNCCENKDGTIKTFSSTTAAVGPVLGGFRLNSNHTETLTAPTRFH